MLVRVLRVSLPVGASTIRVHVQEVLRGYIGDRNSKPIFPEESFWGSAFGTVGKGYQRPFELATLRLQNMIGSLSNCAASLPFCYVLVYLQ